MVISYVGASKLPLASLQPAREFQSNRQFCFLSSKSLVSVDLKMLRVVMLAWDGWVSAPLASHAMKSKYGGYLTDRFMQPCIWIPQQLLIIIG